MPPPTLTTFLFDLDGTLIDSVDLILTTYRHTLMVHRGSVPDDDVWLQGLGTPLWEQFKLFTNDPAEIEAMVATYREYNLAHHDVMVKRYPGVVEAVRALHQRGRKLGVVTSKLRGGTLRGLKVGGFDGLFDVLVGADDVDRHKPDPAPVLRALELLGAEPSMTVFIGDSPHDMVSGRAAGVRTAAALWGPFPREWLEPHQPDYWLTEPGEIATLDTDG
ncbi:MAG: HAD-IA family hydrolase [Gemmatimonadetes bacterium]|nr:HAD-IA family hydrolase [Gemmatimonadota bacterium]